METVNLDAQSPDLFDESPEEGEILEDEDCFETISDTSISLEDEEVGKFVSYGNNLRALSLSSISVSDSDGEDRRPRHQNRRHDQHPRCRSGASSTTTTAAANDNKKKAKTPTIEEQQKTINRSRRHRHRRHTRGSPEILPPRPPRRKSSSASDYLSRRLQRQLREAVRIDQSEAEHKSLRSRLKGMVCLNDSDDGSSVTVVANEDRDKADKELLRQENKENVNSGTGGSCCNSADVSDNDDLEVLRLEALRTAIENKYKHRKKRKLKPETGGTTESGTKRSCIAVDDEGGFKSVIIKNPNKRSINNDIVVVDDDDDDTLLEDLLNDLNGDRVDNNEESQPKSEPFGLVLVEEIKLEEKLKPKLPSPVEEDEDVLRALVLASMSEKLSSKLDSLEMDDAEKTGTGTDTGPAAKTSGPSVTDETVTVNGATKINQTVCETHIVSNNNDKGRKIVNKKIKPGQFSSTVNNKNKNHVTAAAKNNKPQPPPISTTISTTKQQSKFTRISRAAQTYQTHIAFPPVKPLIINVNGHSDSDSNDDFNEESDLKIRSPVKVVVGVGKGEGVPPRGAPLDIQSTVDDFLKQERAKVEAKMRVARPARLVEREKSKSAVKLLPKSKQIEYKMLVEQIRKKNAEQEMMRKPVSVSKVTSKIEEPVEVNNGSSRIGELPVKTQSVLRSAGNKKGVEERLLQNNGRLQAHKQYEILRPLLTKVKRFEEEYRRCNVNVRRLIKELASEKERLLLCRKNYTTSVKEFFSNKKTIDEESKTLENNGATSASVIKTAISNNNESSKLEDIVVTTATTSDIDSGHTIEREEVERGPVPSKDSKIVTGGGGGGSFKYLSPLERSNRCAKEIDPLSILCPYSFNGSCRDPDCKFNHL